MLGLNFKFSFTFYNHSKIAPNQLNLVDFLDYVNFFIFFIYRGKLAVVFHNRLTVVHSYYIDTAICHPDSPSSSERLFSWLLCVLPAHGCLWAVPWLEKAAFLAQLPTNDRLIWGYRQSQSSQYCFFFVLLWVCTLLLTIELLFVPCLLCTIFYCPQFRTILTS